MLLRNIIKTKDLTRTEYKLGIVEDVFLQDNREASVK